MIIWELLSKSNLSLSELVSERKDRFPSSGEINFFVKDTINCIKTIKNFFKEGVTSVDELDGLSISFKSWRFNLRKSNTEPLVRLNVETKGDQLLLAKKTEELKNLIEKL